jgi:hypothetical protein
MLVGGSAGLTATLSCRNSVSVSPVRARRAHWQEPGPWNASNREGRIFIERERRLSVVTSPPRLTTLLRRSHVCVFGLPTNAACSFSPATITVSGTPAVSTLLSVNTTAPMTASQRKPGLGAYGLAFVGLLLFSPASHLGNPASCNCFRNVGADRMPVLSKLDSSVGQFWWHLKPSPTLRGWGRDCPTKGTG